MTARLLLLALLVPVPAWAGALSDLLMTPNAFAAVPSGIAVAYREDLDAPEGGSLRDVADAEVRVEVRGEGEARELLLVRDADGAAAPLGTFPPGVANPVLLYFLETTVRAMAEATGGSPFYIRNRIREAIGAAGLGPEGAPGDVTLTPFAADPNRDRMAGYGDLTLRLRFEPDRPDRILELSADSAGGQPGYHERLLLIAED
jgi:hypothetical protein